MNLRVDVLVDFMLTGERFTQIKSGKDIYVEFEYINLKILV